MCFLHLMYCLYSVKAQVKVSVDVFLHLMYLYSVKVSVDVFSSLDVLFVFSQGAGQGIRRCVLFT